MFSAEESSLSEDMRHPGDWSLPPRQERSLRAQIEFRLTWQQQELK